ncbi:MAG: hypothetical protein ACKOFM_01315, partial [Actinomycetota bacterium]
MAADVARAVGGELVGSNAHLSGVSFDSRTLTPGQLFVPIIDQRDGHDFIGDETQLVVFPLLHGPMGEDGTVQGMLELA